MGKRHPPKQQRRKCPDFRQSTPGQHQRLPDISKQPVPALKNPAKIPVLPAQEELSHLFGQTDEGPGFAESVESTLTDPALKKVWREKADAISPASGRVTAGLLRHYPTAETQLDLHGCTAQEAETKATAFILAGHYKGLHSLRIITGKGRHSQGKPVLPDVVEQVVTDLRQRGIVAAFHWEKKTKHKSGAIIIHLR